MKKSYFLAFFTLLFVHQLRAQVPGGINYQGVASNQYLLAMSNKPIGLRFTIREKTANGAAVYSEVRQTVTDSFGVFNVVIGGAGAESQSSSIKEVKWSDTTRKYLQVELDIKFPAPGSFVNMGTTQLLSVPFSFYSDISDSTRVADSSHHSDSSHYSQGSGKYFFSASLQPGASYPVGNSETIFGATILKLTSINYNEGGHYKPDSSVFVAPDSGIYQFDFSFMNQAAVSYTPTGAERLFKIV